MSQREWWRQVLEDHRSDGRRDADLGVFEPPYPGSDDCTDMDENQAYRDGFMQRRKELGDRFRWK